MFIEDDNWNDGTDAQPLGNSVVNSTQKSTCSTNVKFKGVGKKSLLRTLQTLGSVPDVKSDVPQESSDSDTEAVPSHTKRKKKRTKRGKQRGVSGNEAGDGGLGLGGKTEKTVPKKLEKKDIKSGPPMVKKTDSDSGKGKEIPKTVKLEEGQGENTEKLSRKQWRNKMKNKRKCKNKYGQDKPEQEVIKSDTTGQQKVGSSSDNSKQTFTQTSTQEKKEKKLKPQKRKKVEEGEYISAMLHTQTLKDDKQLRKEKEPKGSDRVKKGAFESSGRDSKQEAGKPQGEVRDEKQHPTPSKRLKLELSKQQSQKREKLRKLLNSQGPDKRQNPTEQEEEEVVKRSEVDVKQASTDRSATLRSRMEQRLEAARFRYINEVLYTTSSGEAKRMFKQDPQAFGIYHKGFTAQVQRWPANPVDDIISYIQQKPATLVVADFGCGDCKVARSVKNKVHSFDLAPVCDLVTVCDMANVPLDDGTVDIAVFCLSLMGTNLVDFLVEANRVLVMGGVLKVAEVASRFENARSFLTVLAGLGFKSVSKDTENSHFYSFEFVKTGNAPENVKKSGLQLKPCVYKKR
ncbi:uncharacterized protein rrp8 [Polymixia lowei]